MHEKAWLNRREKKQWCRFGKENKVMSQKSLRVSMEFIPNIATKDTRTMIIAVFEHAVDIWKFRTNRIAQKR